MTYVSTHPQACAQALLGELRERGHELPDIDTAIRRGLLTEEVWCERLAEFRERALAERWDPGHRLRQSLTVPERDALRGLDPAFQTVIQSLSVTYPGEHADKRLQKSTLAVLQRLADHGLVERGPMVSGNRGAPSRTFRITPAGQEALERSQS